MKIVHFKNLKAYDRWNAYRFIHHLNKGTNEKIMIHGKVHRVRHK